MSKVFRPYEPEQMLLMPASLQEWLPPDHLDLSGIVSRYEGKNGVTTIPSPDDVKVLLYAYCMG